MARQGSWEYSPADWAAPTQKPLTRSSDGLSGVARDSTSGWGASQDDAYPVLAIPGLEHSDHAFVILNKTVQIPQII